LLCISAPCLSNWWTLRNSFYSLNFFYKSHSILFFYNLSFINCSWSSNARHVV
jgi:hypothetical protein